VLRACDSSAGPPHTVRGKGVCSADSAGDAGGAGEAGGRFRFCFRSFADLRVHATFFVHCPPVPHCARHTACVQRRIADAAPAGVGT